MKKHLLFLSGIFSALTVFGQSIPNGNFEQWTSGTYDIPQNYVQCSNPQAFYANLPFNEIKSTDSYHGNYAVQMTTQISNGDSIFAFFINTNPDNGNGPSSWRGGFAYNQKPTGMRGYYKSSVASPDSARVGAFFYKSGALIGQYTFALYGTHNTYTLFSFTFTPALAVNPDTVIFAAGASDFFNQNLLKNGSMLKLDSVSFTGVSSQPALFNGDFENWQTQTLNMPNSWYTQQEGGNQNGVYQTADAYKGNYAVELKTFSGNSNNHPAAQSGQISTGYYLNNCNGPSCEKGGYSFSNQIDTLAFWYKYVPKGYDSANVNLNFKKTGNGIILSTGINLGASATYKYVEMPFNIGQTPDTAIVQFQSSLWQDSAISYIGSDLKVDEAHFKSQPLNTGIFEFNNEKSIVLFPNPCRDAFALNTKNISGSSIENISIYDLLGNIVKNKMYPNGLMNSSEKFDMSGLPAGLYIIQMITKDGIYRGKLNKIE